MGVMTSDDYESGSISAAFGGNSVRSIRPEELARALALQSKPMMNVQLKIGS